MTKDEALKMAIEALNEHEPDWECNKGYHHNQCPNVDCNCKEKKYWKTLDDCKKAIESYLEIGIKSDLDKGFDYTYRILPDKNGLYWLLQSDLKEALEQPAQEPAYQVGEIVNPYGSNIKIKQPAQEPVAWYGKDTAFSNGNKIFVFNNKDDANAYGLRKSVSIEPLYTHPAPSWQGLSDDEIMNIARESYMSRDGGDIKFARAINDKLKEKNYG